MKEHRTTTVEQILILNI